jgi:hypothetical protein
VQNEQRRATKNPKQRNNPWYQIHKNGFIYIDFSLATEGNLHYFAILRLSTRVRHK